MWTVDCGNGLLDLPKPSKYTWNTLARPSETISLLGVLRLGHIEKVGIAIRMWD